MSVPVFVVIDNYADVVSGIEEKPTRVLIGLNHIVSGDVFEHEGKKYVKLNVKNAYISVELDEFRSLTARAATWLCGL